MSSEDLTPVPQQSSDSHLAFPRTKIVALLGAGSTLADALGRGEKHLPPLDRGFFESVEKYRPAATERFVSQMLSQLGIDFRDARSDSLEMALSLVSSLIASTVKPGFVDELTNLLYKLLLDSIGATTNGLNPDSAAPLCQFLDTILATGIDPAALTVVTFNYDLQIEKALMQIGHDPRYLDRDHPIAAFPQYYGWQGVLPVRGIESNDPFITVTAVAEGPMLRVLKLHGSVNWFALHRSEDPPTSVLFDTGRAIYVTNSRNVRSTFRYKDKKRSEHALPVIIPPVNHKSGIMPRVLYPVWEQAVRALTEADVVVVFGYSCPPADWEAASLFRRASNSRTRDLRLIICDPNTGVIERFNELLRPISTVHYADIHRLLPDFRRLLDAIL
jgi:hypothetical protein